MRWKEEGSEKTNSITRHALEKSFLGHCHISSSHLYLKYNSTTNHLNSLICGSIKCMYCSLTSSHLSPCKYIQYKIKSKIILCVLWLFWSDHQSFASSLLLSSWSIRLYSGVYKKQNKMVGWEKSGPRQDFGPTILLFVQLAKSAQYLTVARQLAAISVTWLVWHLVTLITFTVT